MSGQITRVYIGDWNDGHGQDFEVYVEIDHAKMLQSNSEMWDHLDKVISNRKMESRLAYGDIVIKLEQFERET